MRGPRGLSTTVNPPAHVLHFYCRCSGRASLVLDLAGERLSVKAVTGMPFSHRAYAAATAAVIFDSIPFCSYITGPPMMPMAGVPLGAALHRAPPRASTLHLP